MNIFYVNSDSILAAQSLVDSHVVKMILESCQLLSTAHRLLDGKMSVVSVVSPKTGKVRKKKVWVLPDARESILYQATHINHPSAIWCRESKDNYLWLYNHTVELTREYTFRYGKRHKCCDLLGWLGAVPHNIAEVPFTQPTPAMDPKYIISSDSVENYRNYYNHGKVHLHKYKKRSPPEWLVYNTGQTKT
jgi:hypothetical protein